MISQSADTLEVENPLNFETIKLRGAEMSQISDDLLKVGRLDVLLERESWALEYGP
jgi:hypothetical protein